HLAGGLRQQFADVDAGDARRNGAERAAELGARFRVPAFELAHAAVEPDEEDLLAALTHFRGDSGFGERAQGRETGGAGEAREHLPPRHAVDGGVAFVRGHSDTSVGQVFNLPNPHGKLKTCPTSISDSVETRSTPATPKRVPGSPAPARRRASP